MGSSEIVTYWHTSGLHALYCRLLHLDRRRPLQVCGLCLQLAQSLTQLDRLRNTVQHVFCCLSFSAARHMARGLPGHFSRLPRDLSIRCLHPEPNASTRALRVLQIVLPLCQRVLLHTHLRDEQRPGSELRCSLLARLCTF
jgi:hypothetical protein